MADNFQGKDVVVLQPSDALIPVKFSTPVCTTASANDGSIPYGDTVASAIVTAYASDNTVVTTELIESSSVGSNIVTVVFNYPSTTGEGTYRVKIVVTTANGVDIEFDFNRIYAKDN
jgi:hypothetical protein